MSGAEYRIVPYGGWPRCLELKNDSIELVITLDVGPRIIRFAKRGGANVFKEFDDELGKRTGEDWLSFGGHRLWHAPEAFPRSYAPDFEQVASEWDGQTLRLMQAMEPDTRIQKRIDIALHDDHVRLSHRLTNCNVWPIEVAPWCLSVLRGGGRAFLPQEPFHPHPDVLTPARPLVLWHFTRMSDPRFQWGDELVVLREDPRIESKQKIGARNAQGWLGYEAFGSLFIKTFDLFAGSTYPDFGCNCELYTQPGFLELESLGPLARLEPGQTVEHVELWHLWEGVSLPAEEQPLLGALRPYLARLNFPAAASSIAGTP